MVKTVGIERTTDKWIRRARVAGPDYEAGIKAPKRSWQKAATEAKDVFRAAITAPEVPDLFVRGITRAGDARWSEMAIKKGVDRFAPGVELSQPYYRAQMQDILAQIEAVVLKPRGPRGAAVNYQRVKDIGDRLHAWRLARRAAGASS